jgi:hypothetical protein
VSIDIGREMVKIAVFESGQRYGSGELQGFLHLSFDAHGQRHRQREKNKVHILHTFLPKRMQHAAGFMRLASSLQTANPLPGSAHQNSRACISSPRNR